MVTSGLAESTTCTQLTATELDAALPLPTASWAFAASAWTVTVPDVVMPETRTSKTSGPPDTLATSVPPAVEPVKSMSDPSNPVTGSEKVAVRAIGEVEVGLLCPEASAKASVGGSWSTVTVAVPDSVFPLSAVST